MVGLVLLVQVPDAGDVRRVAFLLRPGNSFVLGLERPEHVVGVILDNVIIDRGSFLPPFWTCFDVNDIHGSLLASPPGYGRLSSQPNGSRAPSRFLMIPVTEIQAGYSYLQPVEWEARAMAKYFIATILGVVLIATFTIGAVRGSSTPRSEQELLQLTPINF
jgi:hypothetical protein